MAGLLLLTCTLLATWRPALSSGSVLKRSAGSNVQLQCMKQCRSEPVWTWVPHYPSCVAMNSSDAVIRGSPSNANSVIHQHFGDRLVKKENGCALLLEKAQLNDSGIFNCTTNNQSQQVNLDISYNCSSCQGTDKLGQWMKLSCCSEGKCRQKTKSYDADSSFTWMHKGLQLNAALIDKKLKNSIIIDKLTLEHRGLWSCLYMDGSVAIEFCLEVQEEDHTAALTTSPQPVESQSEVPLSGGSEEEERHSREDGDRSVPNTAVWGIAGALAAILIVLLMVGVYCCIRGRNQGTTDSEKNNAQMETDEPAVGRSASAGEASYAAIQVQSGTGGPRAEQPRRDEQDTGEVQYCLLDFKKEEGRAVPPINPETILYSEVARK